MIDVFIESRYRVNRKKIREEAARFLEKMGVSQLLYDFSIAIVGDRKMKSLYLKHKGKNETTPVLSFLINEKVKDENGERSLIGEIVISYPQVLLFASEENKLIEKKIGEFVEHGLTSLLTEN